MLTRKKSPEVRFAGFNEDWIEDYLENEVEFFSGLTYSPLDVQKDYGTFVIRSSNVKNNELVNADDVFVNSEIVNSLNVDKGDIAVVVRNGSRSLIGKHAQIKIDLKDTVIGAFMTGLRPKNNSDFLNALLDTQTFQKEIQKNLGATINQITTGPFKKMEFFFPKPEEQEVVGEFFKNLNKSISASKEKLTKLKNLKKALLTKMFPQNGSSVPEVRFKGFDREWELSRLDKIAEIVGGGTPSTTNPDYWNGNIDWYSPTEIDDLPYKQGSLKKITPLGLASCSATILPANRTILFTSRAGIGKMAILENEGSTNQGFQSLILNDNIDTYFIYSAGYLIVKYALSKASGSTFLEISSKILGKMPILIPNENEQKKIGCYFKNLDDLIGKHQEQLKKLNNIKNACLNKIFVA